MDKQEWKKRMNFIRSATLAKGEKWGKQQIRQAAEMIQATQLIKTAVRSPSNHQEPTDIQNILKNMGVRIEQPRPVSPV